MQRLLLTLLLAAASAFAGNWTKLQSIGAGEKIEVTTRDGSKTMGSMVSVSADTLVFRTPSGEQSTARADVRKVRVRDPGHRLNRGLIWTAIGAGAGAGIGLAVCPFCFNEGHGAKFLGPGIAIGAGVGALGFLTSPYRTVYKQ